MSEKIINIYKKILKNCNENIIEIEKNFIDELSNIEIDNTIKIFNLLRCLISLNKKPNLKYLFQDKTLSSSSIDTNKDEVYAALPVHTSTKTVISNGKYSPIITRFLEKLIQLKISSVYDQLEKLINLRFSNLTVEPEEILIWDKLTDGKLIPTQPSYEIVILLYRLSNSLTENNQYNDIFQIEEFKNLKNSISQNLAECILKSIPEEITTNPDSQQILSQKLLLTYADLIYIFSFIYYDRNTTVDEIITKFFTKDEKFKFFLEKATTLQKEDSLLKDNENLRIISKNIIDFYKGNQCLFVF
ncbi:hypothetical protein PACTADRAFT_50585 [Pachysolen tannophilus NRRL Y-2460]|uniref:Uncharacterized protein n=1 Tax=Pachysolen tannophilus NRRL Y-2460 TaxID=669874 RepID=A0A1E4TSI7_PACTA|nr:hypothetical protein PACTADRAFT_50585 [Pachysolen tannophilus NRRL Y-2460]